MKPKRRYLSVQEKAVVIERQRSRCACGCRGAFKDVRDIEFDHAIPLWLGGTNGLDNFRALIKKHHLRKTKKEAAARAKGNRIIARGGMLRKRPSEKDKVLAKMAGIGGA